MATFRELAAHSAYDMFPKCIFGCFSPECLGWDFGSGH